MAIHIAAHFLAPLLLGVMAYGTRWRRATFMMAATMVVDVDHLLATPIYDPNRCSVGFHPLHSTIAIALYIAAFVAPLLIAKTGIDERVRARAWPIHVVGLGLLIHMALDWIECVRH